jgi:hypothetical protein
LRSCSRGLQARLPNDHCSDSWGALRYGCAGIGFSLAVVDPVAGRILKIEPVAGEVVRLAATTTELVGLAASPDAIAPSRLLVFDMDGAVRPRTLVGRAVSARLKAAEGWSRRAPGSATVCSPFRARTTRCSAGQKAA